MHQYKCQYDIHVSIISIIICIYIVGGCVGFGLGFGLVGGWLCEMYKLPLSCVARHPSATICMKCEEALEVYLCSPNNHMSISLYCCIHLLHYIAVSQMYIIISCYAPDLIIQCTTDTTTIILD